MPASGLRALGSPATAAFLARMDGSLTPHKGGEALPQGAGKARVAPNLRKAWKLRIEQGLTIKAACEAAGYSEAGWHLAMKRPLVAAMYEAEELAFVQTVERRRKGYRARAFVVGAELMERAQSEQVRARMVEFFAGETKQPLVNISVGQSQEPATGYRYKRPDDASTDRTSGVEDAQVVDVQAQSPEVGE